MSPFGVGPSEDLGAGGGPCLRMLTLQEQAVSHCPKGEASESGIDL